MTDLQKMKRWLDLCPWLQVDGLYTDTTLAQPANAGIYPKGRRVLHIKEDVLGNRWARCRDTYLLRCVFPQGEEAAEHLQRIQNWIFFQNLQGITPGLGREERVRGENGRLERITQVGTAMYVLTLTVEMNLYDEGV